MTTILWKQKKIKVDCQSYFLAGDEGLNLNCYSVNLNS
jgi:hypothetical protein